MRIMIYKIISYQTQKKNQDFDIPFRRYDYLCNNTVITSANKLRDFQCKFAHVH